MDSSQPEPCPRRQRSLGSRETACGFEGPRKGEGGGEDVAAVEQPGEVVVL